MEIVLTQGKTTVIDDSDYNLIKMHKWCAWMSKCGVWYAVTNDKFNNRKQIKMHRLLLGLTDSNILADHIDGDGLNNQRYNLRIATRHQNNLNKKSQCNSTSKYLGVYVTKRKSDGVNRYLSQIKINGKSTHLGTFDTEFQAALEYDKMAKIHFGEFARLNFKNDE